MPFLLSIGLNLIIGLVLSIGSTLLQQALAPKPKPTDQTANRINGFRGSVQTGGQVNQSFLIGTIGTAGKLEYRSAWGASGGTPNAYLVDVISYGDLAIASATPTAMWVDSQPVTVSTSGHTTQGYPVAEYNSSGDHLWWEGFKGDQTTVNSYLTTEFGSDADRPWLSDMIGRQLPLLTVTALVAENLWTGFPAVVAQWQGIPLYDPRQDTTAGGSGSQRWADASTWAFSDNNMVAIYNAMRGIYDADGNHVWGGSASAYQLPYAAWAAAMDACDEDVSLAAGGTEKRFRCGREIFLNERPADVITELLTGCNGRIAWAGGQCFPLVGLPASADGTFTDADILASESITQTPFPNLDEVINGGTASYMEPSQAWEFKDTAPYTVADYVTADDSREQKVNLKLSTTFSGTQAQRVLKATVEEGRRFLKWAVALTPGFAQYRPLQRLDWTSAENQYTAKAFLIVARTIDPWGNVFLGLQEIDPADHDWTAGTDEKALSFAPLTPITPAPIPMTGWAVAPYIYPDSTGTDRRIGIQVSFAGGLQDVTGVRIQVRENFGSNNVVWDSGEQPYDRTEADPVTRAITWAGIIPNTAYQVRGRFISPPASGRANDWSSWLGVTTANVAISRDDLGASLRAFDDWIGIQVRDINMALQLATSGAADQDAGNYADKQYLLTQVRVGDNKVTAGYTESILVALGASGTALSDAIAAVDAASGDVSAGLISRMTAFASPGGGWARYGLQVRANVGVSFSASASIYLEAKTDGTSRIGLVANQTVFFADDGTAIALIGGDGVFRSANNVVQLDMIGGAFSITVP